MFRSVTKSKLFHIAAASLVFSFLSAAPSAFAHDFWVNAARPENGVLKAEIGYGHGFPKPETIAEERVHLFDSLYLATPEEKVKLVQSGENYAYEGKKELTKGSYMVLGYYHPTFWSNGDDGWAQKDRHQRPDAKYCEEVSMFAKTILNIDGSDDDSFITKPTGQRLEIVPLMNPAKVKAGEKFTVQILVDGKPLKTAKLEATFGGFSDKDFKAFSGRADLQGIIDIIPLKAGYWFAKVSHAFEHEDKTRADEVVLVSTLTFHIGE